MKRILCIAFIVAFAACSALKVVGYSGGRDFGETEPAGASECCVAKLCRRWFHGEPSLKGELSGWKNRRCSNQQRDWGHGASQRNRLGGLFDESNVGRLPGLGNAEHHSGALSRHLHDSHELHDSAECHSAVFPRFMPGSRGGNNDDD